MGGEWRERPFGELTENFDSVRVPVKAADRRAGPYPYYGASGIVDRVDSYLFDGEYLLIAEDGENLRTRNTPIAFLARDKFWVNNHAHIVRGNSEADTRFLMYALAVADVSGYLTGSTMPKLTQGNMNRIPLLAPPAGEQRAIAHILGTLDDKIELNRRMNETLEAMTRALFKSWFVDFDPVRAKSEGRDTGLPRHLADLFPDSFEDSELGKIPKGWGVRTLGDIAEHMIGGDWGADGPSGANTCAVRCLRGVDLHSLRTTGWSNAPVRYVSESSLAKRRPEPGDVIVEGSGECGRSLAFTDHIAGVFDEPIVYSNFCKRVRTASQCHALFVESVLNGLVRSGDMKSFVTGTAMPNLDLKGLMVGIRVVLPPTALLEMFARTAQMARARLYSRETRTLATLRDTLLPRLVSGELRVSVPQPGASSAT